MSVVGSFGRALRARFAAASSFAMVDGQVVPCDALSVRSMNFGQAWRGSDVASCRYVLEVPLQFFVEFLAEPGALSELLADAKHHPDPADLLDQALVAAGFPNVEQAMLEPTLAQRLAEFFAHDVLVRWLGDAGPEAPPGFVLNSCEIVVLCPSGIRIEGDARPSEASRAYQDL